MYEIQKLKEHIAKYNFMLGAKLVEMLLDMPQTYNSALKLEYYLSDESTDISKELWLDYMIDQESRIPMIDNIAITQVIREADRLKAEIARRKSCKIPRQLLTDLEKLNKYIKDNTQRNLKPRHFQNGNRKSYQKLMNAYNRYLKILVKDLPETAYYLRSHIITGEYFYFNPEDMTKTCEKVIIHEKKGE